MGEATALTQPTSFRRSFALALTFSGRATRTELASYVLAAMLVTLAVSFVASLTAPFEVRALIAKGLGLLFAIPAPALLARRFHDLGRPGAWAWLAVFSFAVWALRSAVSFAAGVDGRIGFDRLTWPLDWLVVFANLVVVILAILPGSPGPNRYGPDPRQPAR